MPILHNHNADFIKLNPHISWQGEIIAHIKNMYSVRNEMAAALKIQNLFFSIWVKLYENIPQESSLTIQNSDLSILTNMIGFIQKNYTEIITLADIAASGAVGQSKCCKLFGKYIRQTPNRYLMEYRLNKSTVLLKSTDMSVLEIATAVGFSGSSYYAEAFRKWSGKSPSEYRKLR